MSKVLIDSDLLEQALEALNASMPHNNDMDEDWPSHIAARRALRAALEQEKSPQNASSALQASCEVPQVTDQTEHFLVLADEEVYCTKHPQVEQSSVVGVIGWKNHLPNSGTVVHWTALMPPLGTKLYTHPQPRRGPLTDEQITELADAHMEAFAQFVGAGEVWFEGEKEFARAVERAHGITGEQE